MIRCSNRATRGFFIAHQPFTMSIDKYIPTGRSVTDLARADDVALGQILRHAFEVRAKERETEFKTTPRIGTEKMKQDIRYKIGEVEGLEFYSWLVSEAQKSVS